jgi:RNA polymerase sigma-70 factor, ECF subfamily
VKPAHEGGASPSDGAAFSTKARDRTFGLADSNWLWLGVIGSKIVPDEPDDLTQLERRVDQGDGQALLALFSCHRQRLKHIIRLRIDDRLKRRVDPSDVLQEAFLDVARRAADYLAAPTLPPFLWFRWVAREKLLALHRRHLGARLRDAGLEVSIHQRGLPHASSASLAAMLLGRLTSPTLAARRVEVQKKIQDALDGMDSIDREIITLRHFEELSNVEAAKVLGLSKTAASNRYIRALKRLKDALGGLDGVLEI